MRQVKRTRLIVSTHVNDDPMRPTTITTVFPFSLDQEAYYSNFSNLGGTGPERMEIVIGDWLAGSVGGRPENIETIAESEIVRGDLDVDSQG
ncbi:hypothetical protein [Lacticaseibacillus hegangensis]|uniref:Uncharacterized protein n=1 Tax=Lacticaseibacillus hegangensis TaxID=2486010 RepID=A0ABW4CYX2_9LACO|nr:hypothetical protein [Lacticaseibacillus hegangensis]